MKKIDLTQEEILIFKQFLKEYKDSKTKNCLDCNGTGFSINIFDFDGTKAEASHCYACNGTGKK